MVLHTGARKVDRVDVEMVEAPPPTKSWFPVRHRDVLRTVEERLTEAGFAIARSQFALTATGARFFGTLDLTASIVDGVNLSVGIRNSIDKSFPIGFCCGERVFVCDNLAFGASTIIAKKHTRFGSQRFSERLSDVILGLSEYQIQAKQRIYRLQCHELSADQANSLILQAFEHGVVSYRTLPKVIQEYRTPRHQEFEPRTAWSLLNAFTEILKVRQSNPAMFASLTIRLQGLLDPVAPLAVAT